MVMDYLSNIVWLESTGGRTAANGQEAWCKALDVPQVWLSDIVSHLNDLILNSLKTALNVTQQILGSQHARKK